jgi:hypothetical protein
MYFLMFCFTFSRVLARIPIFVLSRFVHQFSNYSFRKLSCSPVFSKDLRAYIDELKASGENPTAIKVQLCILLVRHS